MLHFIRLQKAILLCMYVKYLECTPPCPLLPSPIVSLFSQFGFCTYVYDFVCLYITQGPQMRENPELTYYDCSQLYLLSCKWYKFFFVIVVLFFNGWEKWTLRLISFCS